MNTTQCIYILGYKSYWIQWNFFNECFFCQWEWMIQFYSQKAIVFAFINYYIFPICFRNIDQIKFVVLTVLICYHNFQIVAKVFINHYKCKFYFCSLNPLWNNSWRFSNAVSLNIKFFQYIVSSELLVQLCFNIWLSKGVKISVI